MKPPSLVLGPVRRGQLTRRQFLASASAAIAIPNVVPWRILGVGQTPGANERLTVAHIGVGGMGSVDLANMLIFRDQGM